MNSKVGSISASAYKEQERPNEFAQQISSLEVEDFAELRGDYDSIKPVSASDTQMRRLERLHYAFDKQAGKSDVAVDDLSSADANFDIDDLPTKIREKVKAESEAEKQARIDAEEKSNKSDDVKQDDAPANDQDDQKSRDKKLLNTPSEQLTKEELLEKEAAKKRAEAQSNSGNKNEGGGGMSLPSFNIGKSLSAFKNSFGNPLKKGANGQPDIAAKPISNAVMSNNATINNYTAGLSRKRDAHDFALRRFNDQLAKAGMTFDDYKNSYEAVNSARQQGKEPSPKAKEDINKILLNHDLVRTAEEHSAALTDLVSHMSPNNLEVIQKIANNGEVSNSTLDKLKATQEGSVKAAAKGHSVASGKHAGKGSTDETLQLDKIQNFLENFADKFKIDISGFMKSITSAFTRK